MRKHLFLRAPFSLARGAARSAAVLATLGLVSAGIATGATTFQLAYMYGTSGPASGGTAVNLVGNQFDPGATVTIGGVSATASVTSSTRIGATTPGRNAGALYDVVVTNPGNPPAVLTKGWFADFLDVPQASPYHAPVETIIRDGITSGCGGGNYCPTSPVTRGQMAVFLLRAEHGSAYVPPPATGTIFGDVTVNTSFADWIEQLYAEGITGGCLGGSPPMFCPTASVTRGQMATFLLKIYHGTGYAPPAATGVFADVPVSMPLAPWIEEMARLCGDDGLRRQQLLPGQPRHARADGGLPREDVPPPRGHPLPPAGHMGTQGFRDLGPARRGQPLLAREPVQRGALAVPGPAARARRRARRLRRLLPPRQLHQLPAPLAVLPERALPGGSAAAAHAVLPPQDQRHLDEHDHPAESDGSLHQRAERERLRELSRRPRGHDAEPGDGRVSQHGVEHQDESERELRPRGHAALLDRHGAPQPGRHDAEQRRDRLPDGQLRPVGRRQPQARADRLVHPRGLRHAQRRHGQHRQLPDPDARPSQWLGPGRPAHADRQESLRRIPAEQDGRRLPDLDPGGPAGGPGPQHGDRRHVQPSERRARISPRS